MIPESTLRQIAEHSISAESRALAKQLLEAMSLPGYERLAKERDAAREELAKHRRHINRPQYEAMQQERDDANAALRRMTNTHAAVVAERDAARAENERLAKQRDELLGAATDVLAWLKDPRLSTWPYMEGGGFYDDRERFEALLTDAIAAEQPKPAGGGA